MALSGDKELKYSLERSICERLVIKVCGNNEVAYKWGCVPNTDGYKEAERIFNEKYSLTQFSQLEKEILITWYNELLYREKKQKKFPEDRISEDYYYNTVNDFQLISDWVLATTVEDKLNGLPNVIKENAKENSEFIEKIDSVFYMVMNAAKNRNYEFSVDMHSISEAIKSIKKLGIIRAEILGERAKDLCENVKKNLINNEKYAKENNRELLKKKMYFLKELVEIFEDNDKAIDGYLKPNTKKVLANKFEENEYNDEIEKFIEKCLDEKEHLLEDTIDKRKRNKTSETIYEKAYKKKMNSITTKKFEDKFIAFLDMYTIKVENNNNIVNVTSILDYYNAEKRYNLKLYKTMVTVLINYINISKKEREEFLRRVSQLARLDNYLFRHLNVKEVCEKIADEIINDERSYYDSILEEIQDIMGIKHYIVNQLLEIENFKYEELKNKNIEEAVTEILNIDKEYFKELTDIDFEGIADNNKIKNKIYDDIKKLLNMSKDIGMENNEYINL